MIFFFFFFLKKECHWNYSKLHIHDYVICLFLLIDCLYWQVLSLSIVLCLCLLEWKSQAQRSYDWSYESCYTYFFFLPKNTMSTTFLQQILSVTYDLSWKCCGRNTSLFLGSRVKYLFHKFYFFLVRICSINLHMNICFQCYIGVHFLEWLSWHFWSY